MIVLHDNKFEPEKLQAYIALCQARLHEKQIVEFQIRESLRLIMHPVTRYCIIAHCRMLVANFNPVENKVNFCGVRILLDDDMPIGEVEVYLSMRELV